MSYCRTLSPGGAACCFENDQMTIPYNKLPCLQSRIRFGWAWNYLQQYWRMLYFDGCLRKRNLHRCPWKFYLPMWSWIWSDTHDAGEELILNKQQMPTLHIHFLHPYCILNFLCRYAWILMNVKKRLVFAEVVDVLIHLAHFIVNVRGDMNCHKMAPAAKTSMNVQKQGFIK